MTQTPVRIGWNVAAVAVLSVALTGCGGGVDSTGYEVILDQPETAPSIPAEAAAIPAEAAAIPAETAEVTPTETADAEPAPGSTEAPATPAGTVEQPAEAEQASNAGEPDSPSTEQVESVNDPLPAEATTEEPGVAETTTAEASGTDGKPSPESASETADTADPASPKKRTDAVEKKQPRVVKLLIPDKKFKTEGAEKALRVSFDDIDLLKVLNMEPVTEDAPSRMPKWLKDLDGKRIRVRGFMFPPFEDEDIRAFTLARDNQICCFGRNPMVYDLVDVFMRKGESSDYIQNRPFDVIGVFHIGDSIIPGELYSMDDAVVIDR